MSDEPAWTGRYRVGRLTLPVPAADAAHRCVHAARSADGTTQLFATDRRAGTFVRLTDRPHGVTRGWPTADGRYVLWFDGGPAEVGGWRAGPFGGGPAALLAGGDGARAAGVAVASGQVVVGLAGRDGTALWNVDPAGERPARRVAACPVGTRLVGGSADGGLLATSRPDGGDPRRPAMCVLSAADGTVVAELGCGVGVEEPVHAVGFAPVPGDQRLLALTERDGWAAPLLWDVATGDVEYPPLDLPGETRVDWYPDGRALLVCHVHRARSTLLRLDTTDWTVGEPLSPPGFVRDAAVHPDGSVEYLWSSGELPPRVVNSAAGVVLTAPGSPAASVPCTDLTVPGPGGDVHVLLSTPPGPPPYPTVFALHGGPATFDSDSFNPYAAAWVDHGFAVARVNYRGSTGYGRRWRTAAGPEAGHHVGWAELADVTAVRTRLVADGVSDPERLVVAGSSWGGYLTLLALGREPDVWAAGVAEAPIADFALTYELETEPLRALDRAVFGGPPDRVPERWRASSPVTYAERVRAPLLVIAAEDDPRCPFAQVESYLRLLRTHHEMYRHRSGHGVSGTDERIAQVSRQIAFVLDHLSPSP